MPRLRSKATGVVVDVSDETAVILGGFEPAEAADAKAPAIKTAKRATTKATADDKD